VAEVRRLVANGYQEVILTGIHLGHYGVDFNAGRPKSDWVRLSHLLAQLVQLEGEFRIRLSSIEATEVTRELIDVMAAHPAQICPHLHISLQSGSDRILRSMRRRWGSQRFVGRCRLVKQKLDQPAFTTDVIVGYPGETETDFEETCRVVEEVGFCKLHIFPFSPRRGTPAAEMPDQVPKHIKQERARRLAELERQLARRYCASLLGRRLQVMVESPLAGRPGWAYGTSCRYVQVALPATPQCFGKFRDATPVCFVAERLEV
jgi:threonylcarbamoyladenosine tRNA methylthiotransferase MtaB